MADTFQVSSVHSERVQGLPDDKLVLRSNTGPTKMQKIELSNVVHRELSYHVPGLVLTFSRLLLHVLDPIPRNFGKSK